MRRLGKTAWGVALVAISVTAFASTFVAGSALAKEHGVSAEVLAVMRFVVACAAMFAVEATTKEKRRRLAGLAPRDWLACAVLGPIGTSVMAWCVFKGCSLVSTANASMADALAPLLMFAMAAVAARRIRPVQVAGMLFGFLGALFVIGIVNADGLALSAYSRGDVYVFCAAATWAVYSVYGRATIRRIGSGPYTCWTMFFGIASFAPVLALGSFAWPSTPKAWWLLLVLGTVCTLLPFWTWNAAQKYLPVSTLGVGAYFTPIAAVLLAFAFLGETVTPMQVAGTLLVCASALVEVKGTGGKSRRTRPRRRPTLAENSSAP
ncbi:MAG: DMT family transporter [Kiritimatiellia bacterium]